MLSYMLLAVAVVLLLEGEVAELKKGFVALGAVAGRVFGTEVKEGDGAGDIVPFELHLCGSIINDIAVGFKAVFVGHFYEGGDVAFDIVRSAFFVLADGVQPGVDFEDRVVGVGDDAFVKGLCLVGVAQSFV
jgi:hypothetical protein